MEEVLIKLVMMLTPSREMLFCTSRVPGPMKSSPPPGRPEGALKPDSTPGVVSASFRLSRPFRGNLRGRFLVERFANGGFVRNYRRRGGGDGRGLGRMARSPS